MNAGSPSRLLAESPAVLLIVYTPAAGTNPLGHDWIGLHDGPGAAALAAEYRPGTHAACQVARLIAAP